MPTFHPAYLLRQYTRENRQAVFDDLQAVKALVDEAGNG
jgi:uracil-DNA glycosylase